LYLHKSPLVWRWANSQEVREMDTYRVHCVLGSCNRGWQQDLFSFSGIGFLCSRAARCHRRVTWLHSRRECTHTHGCTWGFLISFLYVYNVRDVDDHTWKWRKSLVKQRSGLLTGCFDYCRSAAWKSCSRLPGISTMDLYIPGPGLGGCSTQPVSTSGELTIVHGTRAQ
jgi:hypothetical protein